MGYSDQKYYSNDRVTIVGLATSTFGGLASGAIGTVSAQGATAFKNGLRAASLLGGTVEVATAPGTSIQPVIVALMDGTSTMATATYTGTSGTAGTIQNLTLASGTAASQAAAIGDTLTVNVIGTATTSVAAGQSAGNYHIVIELAQAFV